MRQRMAARCRARTGRSDRGASVVEFAIIMPAFLILLFLLIQAGLYYHAVNVTQSVATTTAREMRAYTGTSGGATVRDLRQNCDQAVANQKAVAAWEALDANHTASRPAATVNCIPGINQVEVVVQAHSVNLLPGIFPQLDITARAQGPAEVFKDQGTN
jgi:Flp pilus assembly protein TadG